LAEIELPNPEELTHLKTRTFERRVALTTAIIAVVLAIASLGGNNATKEMLLAQQRSSDQWAFYQAKSVKEHLTHTRRKELELELAERRAGLSPDVRKQAEALLSELTDEEARYQAEKKEIEKEAKALEHERDENRLRDPYFDFGEALLQIAIVLASIAILSDVRLIFYASLGGAGLGVLLTLNGYLLLVQIPFLQGAGH
jgi:hypothetical protein